MKYLSRDVAFGKLRAMVEGVKMVRKERRTERYEHVPRRFAPWPDSRFSISAASVPAPPACANLLTGGADCIKIEIPDDKGDGFSDGRDKGDFQNLHRNKRSIKLDLKSPAGKKIFMELAASADVIVENYRPDVKHRLGIDYEAVSAFNPRIVYAAYRASDRTGPMRTGPASTRSRRA